VAYALSRHSPGIDFVGCSKQDMAESWCSESIHDSFRTRKPPLDIVLDSAKEIVHHRAIARLRKADNKKYWKDRREEEIKENARIDALDKLAYELAIKFCVSHPEPDLIKTLDELMVEKRARWKEET